MNSLSPSVGLHMPARATDLRDILYASEPVEVVPPIPRNPYYFDDSQIVLKACQTTWLPPSLQITHSSKGRRKDI
jgi:hypothetical protein